MSDADDTLARKARELLQAAASALGGDACGPTPAKVALSEATIQALVPAARQQVLRAGLRLAKELDAALS